MSLAKNLALILYDEICNLEISLRRTRRLLILILIMLIITIAALAWSMIEAREILDKLQPAVKPVAATQAPVNVIERDMIVTAYTCGPESTGKGPGHPEYRVSRSGYRIRPNERVVAAPPDIPFGSMAIVPGYGLAPVVDRGGAIQGDRLDVHIEEVVDALEWGEKRLKVKFMFPAEIPKGGDRP